MYFFKFTIGFDPQNDFFFENPMPNSCYTSVHYKTVSMQGPKMLVIISPENIFFSHAKCLLECLHNCKYPVNPLCTKCVILVLETKYPFLKNEVPFIRELEF